VAAARESTHRREGRLHKKREMSRGSLAPLRERLRSRPGSILLESLFELNARKVLRIGSLKWG